MADQARTVSRARAMRLDAKRGLMTRAFRTRLMLAHTHVNECRYCSWFHTRNALKEGIPAGQAETLLCGVVEGAPGEEVPALLYAIHFAEVDGQVGPEARARMLEVYGEGRTEAIERVLRTVRSGNLVGNSFDYLLFRLTGRRSGRKEHVPMGEPELTLESCATD
jgi:AhpD family alkylhydroperoxidase